MVNKTSKTSKKAPKKPAKKTVAKPAPKKKIAAKPVKAAKAKPAKKVVAPQKAQGKGKPQGLQEWLKDKVVEALDNGKAEDIVTVDVQGQSPIADYLVIATGRSNRQVKALGEAVQKALAENGIRHSRMEGAHAGDWVVVDGGDVIVHIFRPEVRAFYRLEEVWGLEPPLAQTFKDL